MLHKIKLIPSYHTVLIAIHSAAQKLAIDFFIIGATARDIALEHIHDLKPLRATMDIDLAIAVSAWSKFNLLIESIYEIEGFSKTASVHKLRYRNLEIDLVPFGGIESTEHVIKWQDKDKTKMSTLGFTEAYADCYQVEIKKDVVVKTASLLGVFILKVIAWSENPTLRKKDAEDMLEIACNYFFAGNEERIYQDHPDICDIEDYTIEKAGAILLGRDIKKLAQKETLKRIITVLKKELELSSKSMLLKQMQSSTREFDFCKELLQCVIEGLS